MAKAWVMTAARKAYYSSKKKRAAIHGIKTLERRALKSKSSYKRAMYRRASEKLYRLHISK